MSSTHPVRRFIRPIVFIGLLLALVNAQALYDEYAVATYKSTPEVAAIVDRLKLTPQGQRLVARSKPSLLEKGAFNTACETSAEELELGCYYRGRVHVLRISAPELRTEMDTVMAHELLHVAWVRLSAQEQARLGRELTAVARGLNDPDLQRRLEAYRKSQPGQETNELHSILPTEYRNLTPSLEKYYARYFSNRMVIVAAHEEFERVFESRRQSLDQELARIHALKRDLASVNARLDALKAAGRIAEYNRLIPRQNALVEDINRRIGHYRRGVEEYNSLSKELDSNIEPPENLAPVGR